MADKNYSGTQYMRAQQKEKMIIEIIDRRTGNGDDRENVDPVWNQHVINHEGERVWSF